MTVAIPNFQYSYSRNGKPVFVPSSTGRRIGRELKAEVESAHSFDPMYFHLRRGGHVAAMHQHRDSALFCRIDIANFFYSISRRRVQSALDRIGISNPRFYAKWSTVANPYGDPRYSLPYGFVQSPILSTLVMATSRVGEHLSDLIKSDVKVSVYVDDISLSCDDGVRLDDAFKSTLSVLEGDGFRLNTQKFRPPSSQIDIFNCDLKTGFSSVRDDRILEFLAQNPSKDSEDAFVAYCASVEIGNQP